MAKKRKRVPKPIWLLFGPKARTLAETIMDLIPTDCSCNSLSTIKPDLCLHCCFHQGSEHNPSSYLFRPNDPPEYTDLLNRTFVFIPDNAPPLPPGIGGIESLMRKIFALSNSSSKAQPILHPHSRRSRSHGSGCLYLSNHLSSTLHISWQGRPRKQLKEKLCDYLQPKCHHIFYDSNFNSPGTVRLNIYQVFLLSAMKFHCYVRESSSLYKFTSQVCFEAIMSSIRYMHKLIMKKMRTATLRPNCKPIFEMTKEEIVWLGLTAYTRVLNRKQSSYKDLLHRLRFKLTAQGNFEGCPSLMYAVYDAHSSVLWKVKF